MKEALFALAVVLGAAAGISAGYALTRTAEWNIRSYSAPPQAISSTVSIRGTVTRVDEAARSVTVTMPDPYAEKETLLLRLGLDGGTRIPGASSPEQAARIISETIVKKLAALTIERKKNGTLYLRTVRLLNEPM